MESGAEIPLRIILWGATGQARVLGEFLPALGYRIEAIFDRDPGAESPFPGVPFFTGEQAFADWAARRPAGACAAAAAIGGANGADRLDLLARFRTAGLEVPVLIHPRAWLAADASAGAGTQILAMAAVAARAHLGAACIINTGASVDHDCALGDGVHVGPGAVLAGEVIVGARAFVGAGATILPRIVIGPDAVIGAGAVVTRDVAAGTTVTGVPARAVLSPGAARS